MSTQDDVARIKAETAALRMRHRQELARARREIIEDAAWERERRQTNERVRQALARRDAELRRQKLTALKAEVAALCSPAPAAPVAAPAAASRPRTEVVDLRAHTAPPAPHIESISSVVDDLTAIPGIDAATQRRLYLAGILTHRQLCHTPATLLQQLVGPGHPVEAWQADARSLIAGAAG